MNEAFATDRELVHSSGVLTWGAANGRGKIAPALQREAVELRINEKRKCQRGLVANLDDRGPQWRHRCVSSFAVGTQRASTCVLSRQAGSSRPWDGRDRGFGSGSAHGRAHATPYVRSDPALDAVGICYRSLQTDRSFAAEPVNIDECTDRGCLGDHSGGRRARDGKQLGSEQASGDAAG